MGVRRRSTAVLVTQLLISIIVRFLLDTLICWYVISTRSYGGFPAIRINNVPGSPIAHHAVT